MLHVFFSLTLLSAALPVLSSAVGKSIYGEDNRLEYHEATADLQKLADSVVSLWEAKNLTASGSDFKLATMNFGSALNLCPNEKFRAQPIGAFCSGTLVGPDVVMTAGHCITDDAKCADTKFVFGYKVKKEGEAAVTTVPASDVYGCKKIIKRNLGTQPTNFVNTVAVLIGNMVNGGPGPDFALVQLDKKVSGHKALPVNRKQKLVKDTKLFVIGHPVGLPLKLAGGASIRDASARYFFMTDLDTFGGNSGSAVFNAETKLIEGILVRGGTDFVKGPAGCTVSYQVGQKEGKGEAVTKMLDAIVKNIPKDKAIANEKAKADVVDVKVEPPAAPADNTNVKVGF
ncbi:MAG: hypothetical protein A2016_05120 [Elusimicrobia bacterium GWF2_62_30]|nr:MAG: hypothetical protein A2016_05120 [Elusimicrobia bacterium GWF2_62_30]